MIFGRWVFISILAITFSSWGCGGAQIRDEDPLAEEAGGVQEEETGSAEVVEEDVASAGGDGVVEEGVPGAPDALANSAVDADAADSSGDTAQEVAPPDPYQTELDSIDNALDLGNIEDAMTAIQSLEATSPSHSGMAVRRARLMLRQGNVEDARDQALDVIQRDPSAFDAAALVVRANILLDDTGAAMREAQAFAAARPDDLKFQNLALYTMNRAGQPRVVLREARSLLLKDEVNTETMRNIARAYTQLGKNSTAKYVLNRALDVRDEPQSHLLLGKIAFTEGNLTQARAELEKAVAYLPDSPDVLNNLGLICARMVDFEASEKYLVTATKRYPGLAYGHANLGYLYRLMGRPGAAVSSYQRALEIEPAYADVHYNLGLLYFGAEIPGMEGPARYAKAMDSLNQYRDLKRTELTRSENEQIDQYLEEATGMIKMLAESQEDMGEMEMEMEGDDEGMDDGDEYSDEEGDTEEYEDDEGTEEYEEGDGEEEYEEGDDEEEYEEDEEDEDVEYVDENVRTAA